MVETCLNETDFGKLILAACFITDLGTVVALGACFANYDWSLAVFVVVAALALWLAPRFVRWFFTRWSAHVSEPGVKMIFFIRFGLGALATLSRSEAVLPAYMVGLARAGIFAHQRDTIRRLRTTVFAFLTPFYFLNAGTKVYLPALWAGLALSQTFMVHWDLLWWLLPMGLVGGLFRRHVVGRVPWEGEKNLSRLAGDWAAAVDRAIADLRTQAAGWVEAELGTLDRLLGQGAEEAAAYREGLRRLEETGVPVGRQLRP